MWTQNTEKIIKQPKSPNTLFIIIGDICFLKLKSIKRDNLYHIILTRCNQHSWVQLLKIICESLALLNVSYTLFWQKKIRIINIKFFMYQCIHHLHSLLQYFLYCFSQKILNTRLKCFVKENKLWADLGFFFRKTSRYSSLFWWDGGSDLHWVCIPGRLRTV